MADEPLRPPSRWLQFNERASGVEFAACVSALPWLRRVSKRGRGETVLVRPGFMADDRSTALLRSFLRSIGYRALPWERGTNDGRMLDHLPGLIDRVAELQSAHGQRVRLIGWSRGGILAREIARDRPASVDRVITLATPVKGGVDATSIGALVEREVGLDREAMAEQMRMRNRIPIEVPITALYTKRDGVVAWQACIDESNPNVTHHEVVATHTGIGANSRAFRIVADALA